jgi:hypothetical protein
MASIGEETPLGLWISRDCRDELEAENKLLRERLAVFEKG